MVEAFPIRSSLRRSKIRLVALVSEFDGRELWRSLDSAGREVVTVRGRGLRGMRAVRRERALLEALGAESLSAVPRILHTGLREFSIEAVHELGTREGRRKAEHARHSRGFEEQVRIELLDVITELHTRSLSLNLAGARGVGLRADGSVVINDFSRVTEATFSRVKTDHQWLDSIVSGHARSKTVAHRQGTAFAAATEKSVANGGLRRPPARSLDRLSTRADSPLALVMRYRSALLTTAVTVAASAVLAGAIAFTPSVATALAGGGTHKAVPAEGVDSSVHGPRDKPGEPTTASGAAGSRTVVEERRVKDPGSLLTALAEERYAFITGKTAHNPSVAAHSEASRADAQVRNALRESTVKGGHTTVHSASVESQQSDTLEISAVVSEAEMWVTGGKHPGHRERSSQRRILLVLRHDGERWRIHGVSDAGAAAPSAEGS